MAEVTERSWGAFTAALKKESPRQLSPQLNALKEGLPALEVASEFGQSGLNRLDGLQETDIVISNCVVNLAPDKNKVFREIHRVLKPNRA